MLRHAETALIIRHGERRGAVRCEQFGIDRIQVPGSDPLSIDLVDDRSAPETRPRHRRVGVHGHNGKTVLPRFLSCVCIGDNRQGNGAETVNGLLRELTVDIRRQGRPAHRREALDVGIELPSPVTELLVQVVGSHTHKHAVEKLVVRQAEIGRKCRILLVPQVVAPQDAVHIVIHLRLSVVTTASAAGRILGTRDGRNYCGKHSASENRMVKSLHNHSVLDRLLSSAYLRHQVETPHSAHFGARAVQT